MHSTELLVVAQSNLLPFHSQMKGSVIKQIPNRILQTRRLFQSSNIFLQSHSQQFCNSPKIAHQTNEEINILGNKTYKSEVRQKAIKTVGISLSNKKSSGSIMMQNFVKKQPKIEEVITSATKTRPNESICGKVNRYQTGNIFDFQSQSRMSLSCFQDNFKTLRLKKMVSKTEQIIHLKLEGDACKTAQIMRKDQKNCRAKQNVYITQQSGQINFEKPLQTKCSSTKVRSIISRLHQQDQKQKVKTDQENKTHRYKNRSVSASYKNYEKKTSANMRQKLHVNIINFVQQKQNQNAIVDKKMPFNQLYNRFAKTQNLKVQQACDKEIRRMQITPRVLASQDCKELEITNRKNKTQDFKHERMSSCLHNQRQVESTAQKKLKERKNLLRNYTFKKTDTNPNDKEKDQQQSPQDFYVSGWNNSTQFERKQLIMLI